MVAASSKSNEEEGTCSEFHCSDCDIFQNLFVLFSSFNCFEQKHYFAIQLMVIVFGSSNFEGFG